MAQCYFCQILILFLILKSKKDLKANKIIDSSVILDDVGEEDYFRDELLIELETLRLRLLSRIDQFIKHQINKRGITLIENTYTGFDTEYE